MRDIEKCNPDKAISMDFLADLPDEIYAVDIILEKAKEVLIKDSKL
ncbi:hypothetical protein [Hahella sp. HN01]|nr:hypothetical protein [Hahella sp. HN01]MBU6952598.1 hypothetical protein [Hahella sp. HN01]